MNVQQLIQENNDKRKQLTEENEKYYDQLLVFLRCHLLLSEKQTEEILIELLDHLLLAQNEGKTAKEVFGPNPDKYPLEIVEALPKEKGKSVFKFALETLSILIGWFIVVDAFGKAFTKQDTIYLYSVLIVLAILTIGGISMILFILNLLKKSAFHKHRTIDTLKASVGFIVFLGIVVTVNYFSKGLGPALKLDWYVELGIGCTLLLLSSIMKHLRIFKAEN